MLLLTVWVPEQKLRAEKLLNNDNVIYLEDPNGKNSSMNYALVLRDVDDNVVKVFLKTICHHTENIIRNAP